MPLGLCWINNVRSRLIVLKRQNLFINYCLWFPAITYPLALGSCNFKEINTVFTLNYVIGKVNFRSKN